MFCPAIHLACSLTRNATTSEMSSGCPSRPKADMSAPILLHCGSCGNMSVSVNPGETVLAVIPRPPNSLESAFMNCSLAALLPVYTAKPGRLIAVEDDEILMIRPPSSIRRAPSWSAKKRSLGVQGKRRVELVLVAFTETRVAHPDCQTSNSDCCADLRRTLQQPQTKQAC